MDRYEVRAVPRVDALRRLPNPRSRAAFCTQVASYEPVATRRFKFQAVAECSRYNALQGMILSYRVFDTRRQVWL
jgi:hypothetical protein